MGIILGKMYNKYIKVTRATFKTGPAEREG